MRYQIGEVPWDYIHLLGRILDTAKYILIDCIMLSVSKFVLYFMKDSEKGKIRCFLLENWDSLFIPAQLFFSLNNAKKNLYANVPDMPNFNSKTSIWKYPIFCTWYNLFSANISDFYMHFTSKNWKLWGFVPLQNVKLR